MTTPIITDLPVKATTTPPADHAPTIRELDHRRSDGIDVRLLWSQTDDRVVIVVADARTGDTFALAVEAHDALDAFHHPYAHAAARGVPYTCATRTADPTREDRSTYDH